MHLEISIDSHIRFRWTKFKKQDRDCADAIKSEFTKHNPKIYFMKRQGWSTKGIPKTFKSYKTKKGEILIARGGLVRLKKIFKQFGHTFSLHDETLILPAINYSSNIKLREEQEPPVKKILEEFSGIVRGPCSSGKTVILLEAIARSKQPAVVIVWNKTHQKQWLKEATNSELFNLKKSEIGGVGGIFKKRKFGKINICMQQSMCRGDNVEFFRYRVGFVGADEVQKFAAVTFQSVINEFPARYRIGASADEKRPDKLEDLIYHSFGPILHEIPDNAIGSRVKAKIRFIKTKFYNAFYEDNDKSFGLITALTKDQSRNRLIYACIRKLSLQKNIMTLVLTERKEHVLMIAGHFQDYRVGYMMGNFAKKEINPRWPAHVKQFCESFDSDAEEKRIKHLAKKGKIDLIIGTQKADIGLSIKPLQDVHILTPSNVKLFNQQKGRVERECEGKGQPRAFYYWDHNMEKLCDKGVGIQMEYPGIKILKTKPKRRKK